MLPRRAPRRTGACDAASLRTSPGPKGVHDRRRSPPASGSRSHCANSVFHLQRRRWTAHSGETSPVLIPESIWFSIVMGRHVRQKYLVGVLEPTFVWIVLHQFSMRLSTTHRRSNCRKVVASNHCLNENSNSPVSVDPVCEMPWTIGVELTCR